MLSTALVVLAVLLICVVEWVEKEWEREREREREKKTETEKETDI